MKKSAIAFIHNFSYTLVTNFISLIISILVVLIIPKLIGIEDYGYWQLYVFYSSYVTFASLGWSDGIYLRYGGELYHKLDKKILFSQFYMLLFFQIMIAVIVVLFTYLYVNNMNKIFILNMVGINLVIVNMRFMLSFILQATNRMKSYAIIIITDRSLYIIFIILLLIIGFPNYKLMIFSDVLGKMFSLFFAIYICKDIVFKKATSFKMNYREAYLNISVGIKLMLAGIASMLITGVVRFGIERTWNVETFGKISLTFSISNLTMIFINAVGIVLFPILRRTDQSKLTNLYNNMRELLMISLFGILVLYFPLKLIILLWLPQYSDSLSYMAFLFPLVIFEGKMVLLVNTYLKTIRKETLILQVNFISFIISVLFTIVTTILLKNLNTAVISIVVVLFIRSYLAEYALSKQINISIKKSIILESILTSIFIITAWFLDDWLAMLIYTLCYFIYLFLRKSNIKSMNKELWRLIRI